MPVSGDFNIMVWITSEVCEMGVLTLGQDEVIIKLDSKKVITSKNSGEVLFELQNSVILDREGKSIIRPLKNRVRMKLQPVLIVYHPYSGVGGQFIEDVFPHSTGGFYGRLQAGKELAVYVVHSIENSDKFWLSIFDPVSKKIHETQIIQLYEVEALSLIDDMSVRLTIYNQAIATRKSSRKEILNILDSKPPTWQKLSKILTDIAVPNLTLEGTMRDTLNQIVPTSFPNNIREELMAFLAYVLKSKIPKEDPLSYSLEFSATEIMEELINGHIMHLIDETEWPPYVKLMILASRGKLDVPKRAFSDSIKNTPWLLFSQKCAELLPNWLYIAIDSAQRMTKSKQIVVGLPTTKKSAQTSKESWKKRFVEITHGLRIRGNIEPASIGLVEVAYIGAAYRWAHKHMKFIARLGESGINATHLQMMLMPITAAERVKRALPNSLIVGWTGRTLNMNLYDHDSNTWQVPIERIINSIEKHSTLKKLTNQFGHRVIPESHIISKSEAKIADLVSEGVELSYFEIPEVLNTWGLSRKQIEATLSNLVDKKIMHISYEVSDPKLVSLAIIVQGRSESITSFAGQLLADTPTAFVRLNDKGDNGVIVVRLPEESVYPITSQLSYRGLEQELNIRCMRPITFRRYTSNLYQRLLRDDGTWDDDVTAFISQGRSKRKELSESNA